MHTSSLLRYLVGAAVLLTLGGCLTMSGDYKVTAVDANGAPVKMVFTTRGSGIYSVRNAFCLNYPKGTVTIRDLNTGEELSSESPYHCR
ncbi:hypothetical protein [Pseudomonas trivialis]|uniref:Uncharacterized protein n=1 Tax=Pseudomonas trivialis TaxID=200450 RepID=A0A0H5A6D0_9PSED|nr:hypothetical protein [Pseudomonas trivialis]AKS05090.1 hypothetical protein AA957_02845 [Pseudomonas trivialis]